MIKFILCGCVKYMDTNEFYKLMLSGRNSLGGFVMSFEERLDLCFSVGVAVVLKKEVEIIFKQ